MKFLSVKNSVAGGRNNRGQAATGAWPGVPAFLCVFTLQWLGVEVG